MKRLLLLLIIACSLCFCLHAQSGGNPFEMRFRLPKVAQSGTTAAMVTNPFDVVSHRQPGVSDVLLVNTTAPFKPFSLIPKGNTLHQTTLFWVLVLLFSVLTLSVSANRKVLGRAWRGFLNDSALNLAQREASGFAGSTPYYFLYGSFLLQSGLFMFLTARFFNRADFNNFSFLLLCFFLSSGIFLSKHALLRLIEWLFPLGNAITRYNFLIVIFNCILGVFIIPFNFLIAFGGILEGFLLFWTLGLILVFYLYRSFRAASIGTKFLANNQFHFLLYLCAAELTPMLFVVKLALQEAN